METVLALETMVFKENLLNLIGMRREEVLQRYPQPAILNEGGRAERFAWEERAHDDKTNSPLCLRFMARLMDGVVWAVGIHTDAYFSVIEYNAQGSPYFAVIPKGPKHDRHLIHWVARNRDGEYISVGATP